MQKPPKNDSICRHCGCQLGELEREDGECGLCHVFLIHAEHGMFPEKGLTMPSDTPPPRSFPQIRSENQYHGGRFNSAEW